MLIYGIVFDKKGIYMIKLIKPSALKRGDKIATVSLSWGGAGDKEI